jgi:hypothetical protein
MVYIGVVHKKKGSCLAPLFVLVFPDLLILLSLFLSMGPGILLAFVFMGI